MTGLLTEDPHAAVVVAGDLNEAPQVATTQILHGPPGSEVGTAGFDQPDAGDAQRLCHTAASILEGERWSRVYRGRRQLIDHVLSSHALIGAMTPEADPMRNVAWLDSRSHTLSATTSAHATSSQAGAMLYNAAHAYPGTDSAWAPRRLMPMSRLQDWR